MNVPRPAARELALRLLTRASAAPDAPRDKIALASAVCSRLHDELSTWVGREGVLVLMRRALVDSRREHAALARVSVARTDAGCFDGIEEALENHGPEEVFEGFLTLLVQFIDLLGRFLGDNLTKTMLEQNWSQTEDAPERGDRSAEHDG